MCLLWSAAWERNTKVRVTDFRIQLVYFLVPNFYLCKLFESDDWAHFSSVGHCFNPGDTRRPQGRWITDTDVTNTPERVASGLGWLCVLRDVFLMKEQDELPKLVAVLTEQSISTHLKANKSPSQKLKLCFPLCMESSKLTTVGVTSWPSWEMWPRDTKSDLLASRKSNISEAVITETGSMFSIWASQRQPWFKPWGGGWNTFKTFH